MTEILNCECGFAVRGTSIKHAEANLKLHRATRKHREIMKLIKQKEKKKG